MKHLKLRTLRSQVLAPQEPRKGESFTNRQRHGDGPCQGGLDRIQTRECEEGGSGEMQAERERHEGDRRERDDGERERQGIEQWCGTYFMSEKTYTQFSRHSWLN